MVKKLKIPWNMCDVFSKAARKGQLAICAYLSYA